MGYQDSGKEKQSEAALLELGKYELALSIVTRSLEWLTNLGHDTGKGGGRPEPGEFEAAMKQAEKALAAAVPLVQQSTFPIRFAGGEVRYYYPEFQQLNDLITSLMPRWDEMPFEYVIAFANMCSRMTFEKQILEMRDIDSRFRVPIEHGNTGTVVGYDPGGSEAYAVHLDGTNYFYFAEEWDGDPQSAPKSIEFLDE